MKRILAALVLAAIASGGALAERAVFTDGKNLIRLHDDKPCELEFVTNPAFRKAEVHFEGKEYKACWAVHPDVPDAVFIVDETQDSGFVPNYLFEVEKSA